jgi:hypothetical protein
VGWRVGRGGSGGEKWVKCDRLERVLRIGDSEVGGWVGGPPPRRRKTGGAHCDCQAE